ncbi:Clavesin-2,Clavesin-1 [Mytilus coruscus]|uniref:Clavesin-2,Clavesin-1 n=1 Tax=Mytilus coruscus TaxID=42192 RepID=A0A6J8AFK9_MYTCO|nr:Clavesin-2,Clavesin-1 [Mytilus coruscus]
MSDVTIDTITISDNGTHNQTSDDAQILTSEELILSVLRGEIPAVTDDNGFLTVEIENITVDNPSLSSSIEDIFSLPAPQVSSYKSGSKRKITSEMKKILTNDEILFKKDDKCIHPVLCKDCFPARFGAVHFVNQPWYIEAMFKLLKPFLKEKSRDRIHMHGINLGTLHNYIHKEVLPAELGGTLPPYNNLIWAKELIGDESFSFGDKQIYWPDYCFSSKNRSESLPSELYTKAEYEEEEVSRDIDDIIKNKPKLTSSKSLGNARAHLDEEFFLIE